MGLEGQARTHVGNTTDVGPEIGSGTAKDADVRGDMDFYDIDCAPSNFLNLLGTWPITITGGHVELPVEDVGIVEQNQRHHYRAVVGPTAPPVRI